MINEKRQIINILPQIEERDDTLYTLYLKAKIKRSEDDLKNGRVMTVEESKERMRKKYESFNV